MSSWLTQPTSTVQPLCWRRAPVPREQRRYDSHARCVGGADRIELLLEYRGAPIKGSKYTGLSLLPYPHGPTYVDQDLLRFDTGAQRVWVAESELVRQNIEILPSPPAVEEFAL